MNSQSYGWQNDDSSDWSEDGDWSDWSDIDQSDFVAVPNPQLENSFFERRETN